MAEQGFIQRGLSGFRSTMRNVGGAVQKAAAGAAKKVKTSFGAVEKSVGYTQTDAYNDDDEQQQRRHKAKRFLGDDEPAYVGLRTETKRDMSTVSPEFRAQLQAGITEAQSMTAGSLSKD